MASFCHACLAQSLAVNPMGELFPCGQTMGDPHFAAGTVLKPRLDTLGSLSDGSLCSARCNGCGLQGCCPGDCPSRLHYNRNKNPRLVCDLYQTLLKSVEKQPKEVSPHESAHCDRRLRHHQPRPHGL
jgi:uncharacterized protein